MPPISWKNGAARNKKVGSFAISRLIPETIPSKKSRFLLDMLYRRRKPGGAFFRRTHVVVGGALAEIEPALGVHRKKVVVFVAERNGLPGSASLGGDIRFHVFFQITGREAKGLYQLFVFRPERDKFFLFHKYCVVSACHLRGRLQHLVRHRCGIQTLSCSCWGPAPA